MRSTFTRATCVAGLSTSKTSQSPAQKSSWWNSGAEQGDDFVVVDARVASAAKVKQLATVKNPRMRAFTPECLVIRKSSFVDSWEEVFHAALQAAVHVARRREKSPRSSHTLARAQS